MCQDCLSPATREMIAVVMHAGREAERLMREGVDLPPEALQAVALGYCEVMRRTHQTHTGPFEA